MGLESRMLHNEGTLKVESGGNKRVWALAAAGAGMLTIAGVVWMTPAATQAAPHADAQQAGIAAGVYPSYTGGKVVQSGPDHWDLQVGIRWTCAMDRPGVEEAGGLIRLWSPENDAFRIDLPCQLNATVQPGHPVHQSVSIPWEEGNRVHQWLQDATPEDVRSAFVAEWATAAPDLSPGESEEPMPFQTASRRSNRRVSSGHMKISPR